jgi:putative ABC transport system permease protein
VVRALDRKLVRDLWQLRSQVVTVALVVASAFSGFAGSLATYFSLVQARDDFYASARFAHVFIELKRAPLALAARLERIDGVAGVRATVIFDVTLDVPNVAEPVTGRLIGLPDSAAAGLNALVIRRGRMPEPHSASEVVVSEGFASARGVVPGASLEALINGKLQTLHVAGIGLSPDYIYATRGGAFPDDRSFGVLWMARESLSAAYDMEGAFNHVDLRLAPGASERRVIDAADRLLAPYGGTRAYGRDQQVSHRILGQEIDQWKVIGTLIPSIFLAVSAFLLNVVLGRQVATQRGQIAALKALGYGNGTLLRHYLSQVVVIVALGIAAGTAIGWWFGSAVTGLYADFFHFPSYRFRMPAWVMLAAGLVTLGAAMSGASMAVRKTVSLAPAEAMQPPAPGRYRRTLIERLGLGRMLPASTRMTLRNLERRPWRALLTTLGIGSAMAIVIAGMFWRDALDEMIAVQFENAQRGDAEIALVEPQPAAVIADVARLPGVLRVEAFRDVPVRLVAAHRSYRTALQGIPPGSELRRLLDAERRPIDVPPEGVLLTDRLAERLDVRPGDRLRIEVLSGEMRQRDVVVAGTVADMVGAFAYMSLDALGGMIGEAGLVSSLSLRVDPAESAALFRALKQMPRVATAASKEAMLANFRETSARNVLFYTSVLTAFAVVIAIGIVYNNARIALQERAWELASLRVLGFTRAEVSTFLLGELALELVAALPLGCLIGYGLAWIMVAAMQHELMSIPVVVLPRTYALAALAVVTAGIVSALIVRLRIDALDLVAVLKTRE